MASQDAELRLKVSLDLAFFRQEMQKVSNIASSEFTGRLAVKFNRQTLDAELNNLQKAIKRRTYRIEIGGNIDTLPTKIQKLK
jgi:outer membrane biogenesis lipoprotein LolB